MGCDRELIDDDQRSYDAEPRFHRLASEEAAGRPLRLEVEREQARGYPDRPGR